MTYKPVVQELKRLRQEEVEFRAILCSASVSLDRKGRRERSSEHNLEREG